MRLTDKGEDIYNQLASLMDQVLGMQQIESKLAVSLYRVIVIGRVK